VVTNVAGGSAAIAAPSPDGDVDPATVVDVAGTMVTGRGATAAPVDRDPTADPVTDELTPLDPVVEVESPGTPPSDREGTGVGATTKVAVM
jgi:hypothetical protein